MCTAGQCEFEITLSFHFGFENMKEPRFFLDLMDLNSANYNEWIIRTQTSSTQKILT